MKCRMWILGLLSVAVAGSAVHAEEFAFLRRHRGPYWSPNCPAPVTPPTAPVEPGKAAPPALPPEAFAQAPEAGTGETRGFFPNMFGDQLASRICGPLTVKNNGKTTELVRGRPIPAKLFIPGVSVFNFDIFEKGGTGKLLAPGGKVVPVGTPLPPGPLPPDLCSTAAAALIARGAFKITENESPRPQDRVFFAYNYFNNVYGSLSPDGFAQTNIHREHMGFEKTFFDGNASFGMRLPFVQVSGDSSLRREDIGDLTMILKYAFINDRDTGNVFSGGLALTVPTGDSFLPEFVEDVHPTLFQPYVGAIYNMGDFFVHGFSSVVIPTDSRDVTALNNDLGFGYFLRRPGDSDGLITSIVPTFEVHVSTPLNNRGSDQEPIPGIDFVDLTFGVTTGLGYRSSLSLGMVTPVTGPKPFDFETQVYFNFRF